VIDLQNEIEDVSGVEIMVQDVPLAPYNINLSNNKLKVSINGVITIFTIPPSQYDELTLADAITAVTGMNVTYDYSTLKMTYTHIVPFSIIFDHPSYDCLCAILGFLNNTTYPANIFYILVPPYVVNINVDRFAILYIDQVNVYEGSNQVFDKATSIIGNDTVQQLANPIKKKLKNHIARLRRVAVTFRTYYGDLYDFQNIDHRLEIIFESRKNLLSRYAIAWDR
jgi:hypothetical protein